MLRAVVFDFDGVLADTEPLHLEAYQNVLGHEEIDLSVGDYYDRYLGFDDRGIFQALSEERSIGWSATQIESLIERKGRRVAALLRDRDVLFPHAARVVADVARTVPIAIASGAVRPEIEAVLDRAGLRSHFHAIVAAGETDRSKPSPEPYLRVVTLLSSLLQPINGRDASGIVAVEDSMWGIQSARGAGLPCVAVAQTYLPEQLGNADLVVRTIGNLTVDALHELCDKQARASGIPPERQRVP